MLWTLARAFATEDESVEGVHCTHPRGRSPNGTIRQHCLFKGCHHPNQVQRQPATGAIQRVQRTTPAPRHRRRAGARVNLSPAGSPTTANKAAATPQRQKMDARDIYAKFSRPGQLSPPPSPPKRVSFVRDADIEIFLDGSDSDDAPPGRVPLPVATPLKNEAADVDSPLKTPRSPQSSRNDALRRRIERAIGSPPRTPQSSFGERDDDVSSVASSSVASSLMSDDDHPSMVTVAVYAQDGSTLKVLRVPRGTNRALLASSVARQAGVSPSRCRVVDASPNSQASERRAARRRRREARAKAKQPKSRMAAFLAGAAIASAAACLTLAATPYLHKRPTALVVSNEDVTDLRAELEALRRDLAQSNAEVTRLAKRLRTRHAGTDRSLRSLAGGLLDVASLGALRRAAAARDAAARKRNPGAFTKKF